MKKVLLFSSLLVAGLTGSQLSPALAVAGLALLVLDATGHDALVTFRLAFLYFALPLTAVTLAVVGARAWKASRAPAP